MGEDYTYMLPRLAIHYLQAPEIATFWKSTLESMLKRLKIALPSLRIIIMNV